MPPRQTNWVTFSDEELTEISSDEEDELAPPPPPPPIPTRQPPPPVASTSAAHARAKSTRPSTQTATQKSRERGGLKTTVTSLKPARTATYSASSLNEWIEQDLLDLNAEYQRGVVWNEAKQMGLIDSLVNNFHIPQIIFVVNRRSDGSETRVCIDGKQRLTSIRRFLKGEIAYKDTTKNQKLYYTGPPGAKRKLIPAYMQNTFKNKQIACVEYDEVTPEQEREIFQRVQLGLPLGPADRLPAINGPYADLVRSARRRIDGKETFEAYLDWGKTRGKDFQALAQILYLIVHGTEPKKAEPTTTRLEAFLSQQGEEVHTLQATMFKVVDIFCRIVQHPVLGKPLEKDLSPLEFVMSAYLIYTYRKAHTDTELSDAIEQMRNNLKKSCSDRKFSTNTFKHVLNFVQRQVPKLKLKSGPEGEKPAEVASHKVETTTHKFKQNHLETPAPISKASGKRKREEPEDEDSDDEYIAVAKKKVAKQKSEAQTPTLDEPKGRLSLTNRAPSTSKAKTSVKKASPAKRSRAAASGPAQMSSALSAVNQQVARPSVRPPPSARTGSVSSRGNSESSSAMPASASTSNFAMAPTPPLSIGPATSNPRSTSVPRHPLPPRRGVLRPREVPGARSSNVSAFPTIPHPTLELATEQPSTRFDPSVPVVNANASSSSTGRDRLASLRNAKATIANRSRSLVSASSSSNVTGNVGSARPDSTMKFKKIRVMEDSPPGEDGEANWRAGCEILINSFGTGSGSASQLNNRRPSSQVKVSTPMVSSQVLAPIQGMGSSSAGQGSIQSGALATPASTPSPILSSQAPPTGPFAGRPLAQAANTVTRDPRLARRESANQAQRSAVPLPPYSAAAIIPQTSTQYPASTSSSSHAGGILGAGQEPSVLSFRERGEGGDGGEQSILNTSSPKRSRPSAPYSTCSKAASRRRV